MYGAPCDYCQTRDQVEGIKVVKQKLLCQRQFMQVFLENGAVEPRPHCSGGMFMSVVISSDGKMGY